MGFFHLEVSRMKNGENFSYNIVLSDLLYCSLVMMVFWKIMSKKKESAALLKCNQVISLSVLMFKLSSSSSINYDHQQFYYV